MPEGRLARLARALPVYARLAWWGLAAPRLAERASLVVVQGVVRDATGRVLLSVRSDLQGWELPGGTPQPGETPEQALRREIQEETGLDVLVERRVGVYVRSGFRPHHAHVHLCRPVGGALRPSRETPQLGFFDPDRLPRTLFPWYRAPLRDALAGRSEVRCSEHQGVGAVLSGLRIDLEMRLRATPRD